MSRVRRVTFGIRKAFAALRVVAALIGTVLAAAGAAAQTPPAHAPLQSWYPESPIWIGGALYYNEMTRDRVMRWDGAAATEFWRDDGCGPTAFVPRKDNTFLVLCHTGHYVAIVSREGRTLDRIRASGNGQPLRFPNAAVADRGGGIYFSSSGRFLRFDDPSGAIFYIDGAKKVKRVAAGLWYANGVELDPEQRTLYVSEHFARRVLAYPIAAPGEVGAAKTFFDMRQHHDPATPVDPVLGPDGLLVDRQGNLYIAEYGGGNLVIVDRGGRLLRIVKLPDRYVTKAAFGETERTLFVSAVSDLSLPTAPGKIHRLDNPVANSVPR